MTHITGFLDHTRVLPEIDPPKERVKNYNEFDHRYKPEKLKEQSGRCMDCGIPFCHNGCPVGNDIPGFNDAVFNEQWEEAYNILSSTNNFPEFTGRICPAPCETACVLGINQSPVVIKEIEKHIIEIAFEKKLVKPKVPNVRTGKKVAVVGSGPSGLAAAAQLNYAGHEVTVFERDDRPGGLLRYGIPDFKLEKWVVDRRIKVMEAEGVTFRCNANVGSNINIDELLRKYQAIVLAGGSTIPRDLNITGRGLEGIHFAVDFLKQQNKRNAGLPFSGEPISAKGKKVVVIGGGDTGSDCLGTSNRQGAASITQFELMPIPPVARTPYMPWPTYPMILRTSSSQEEGGDREWSIATKAFIGDRDGKLKALKIVNLEWEMSKEGRPLKFTEIPGSERELPCELALLAMGFLHPQKEGLIDELGVDLDERGNVSASLREYRTNVPKIFAAGDMRRGQSLVVWAIAEGRACAKKVDEFLVGVSLLEA